MQVHLTKKSNNAKTGKIPVSTTEQASCPNTCPFNHMNEGGCYAASGPLKLHWDKVSSHDRGMTWTDFCKEIEALPVGQLWRHNQAGDLPQDGKGTIDGFKLAKLVEANEGKRGFTYTHHNLENPKNFMAVFAANEAGFTVNVSANNIKEANDLKKSFPEFPITSVVASTETRKTFTDSGNKYVVCPATHNDKVSCETCKLCSISERDFIIAFPAHGTSKKKADNVAKVA